MSHPFAGPTELVPPWPGEIVDTGDRQVHVRRAPATTPTAEPAVFIHGLGGGSTSWTDLMDLLRDRMDCQAPDLPGFGYSPPPPDGAYGVRAQAQAAASLIESGSYGSVHLFGNSLGGTVATQLAADRPDLVRTLTLISPALPDLRPRPGPVQLLVPLVPAVGPALMRRGGTFEPEELARQNLEGLYGDPTRIHPQRLAEIADDIRGMQAQAHTYDAYVGALRGVVSSYLTRGPGGMWRQARRVRAPTLAIYGEVDRFISPRMAVHAVRCFSRCRVLVLSGIGHVAQMEKPDVVAQAVRAFAPGG